jgi:hypothetical protein
MEIIASEPMTVKKYTYDGFRKIELTNNLSCESYTAFSIESSTDQLISRSLPSSWAA